MHFEDNVLVRLGDPSQRASLFGDEVGERLARATFGIVPNPGETFPLKIDNVVLAVPLELETRMETVGHLDWTQGRLTGEAVLRTGWAEAPVAAALLEGTVTVTMAGSLGRISEVRTAPIPLPTLAELDGPAGPLADPAARERARRIALGLRLVGNGTGLNDDELSDLMARWLAQQGYSQMVEFIEAAGPPSGAAFGVTLQFDLLDAAPPVARAVPFRAAALVREATDSVSWLQAALAEIRRLKRGMLQQPLATPPLDGIAPRDPVPVFLFVPKTLFEDAGWPGALPGASAEDRVKQRMATAAGWLAGEGVVLVSV
ncbi:hypothetical protein [Azospirillum sp.]|uniref:hypothetical protein n=1 Tax=Azospirillum sp. TaxID=34012 RepID=UPI002D436D19|nr:hypothetical protein [Azospirillum sp.]HYF90092.1 hypothetical protein [Azospirillum sp.]